MVIDSYSDLAGPTSTGSPSVEGSAPVQAVPMGLAGRRAFCIYSHENLSPVQKRESLMDSPQPSSNTLPNFEYRGPGSIYALAFCGNCGSGKSAHSNTELLAAGFACGSFIARGPSQFDSFYCRCRGLDPNLSDEPPETPASPEVIAAVLDPEPVEVNDAEHDVAI